MSSSGTPHGRLFVVSAPSGTGKTTVVEEAIRITPQLTRSRSYTSRRARAGETDGVDYNFITRERFEAMKAGDQFLEWAEFSGNLYGTSQVDTERILAGGDDVVLVIDVQGGRQVRRRGWPAVFVFVLPPSFAVLESRLRDRQGDTEEQIQRRLSLARDEVAAVSAYDYVLVNETVGACVEQLQAVVLADRARRRGETGGVDARTLALAERARRDAMGPVIAPIVSSFGPART
jgi:guanylate kinase